MPNHVFIDENNQYKITFNDVLWATDNVHNVYTKIGISDVDWVVQTDSFTLLVEYKNANVSNANNPQAFETKIKTDEHYKKIAQKFYDTLMYLIINNKMNDKLQYIYILERSIDDSMLRKRIRNKIEGKLPFEIQENYPVKIIDLFDVLSIKEWNEKYPMFPLTKVSELT